MTRRVRLTIVRWGSLALLALSGALLAYAVVLLMTHR